MAEDLTELCRRMQLSDKETNRVSLRWEPILKSQKEAQFSILFKILTNRVFNAEAFKGTVRSLWAGSGGVTIRDIEENLFMAVFRTSADIEKVFVQSPWTFDKKLILMVRFTGNLQPTEVRFSQSAFWIRVHNLPIKSMIREVGEDIGHGIGRLVEVDVPDNGFGWGKYLRIRVEIDVMEPLLRGKVLQGAEEGESEPFWVDFKYEHLPIFCYRCGKLGHSSNECVVGRGSDRTTEYVGEKWGSWLRAPVTRVGNVKRSRQPEAHSNEERDTLVNSSANATVVEGHRTPARVVVGDEEISNVMRPENMEGIDPKECTMEQVQLNPRIPDLSPQRSYPNSLNFQFEVGDKDGQDLRWTGDEQDTVIIPTSQLVGVHATTNVGNLAQEITKSAEEDLTCQVVDEGPPKKPKWKKRARGQVSRVAPSSLVPHLGKRSAVAYNEGSEEDVQEPALKRRGINGEALAVNRLFAEAVAQPRQSL